MRWSRAWVPVVAILASSPTAASAAANKEQQLLMAELRMMQQQQQQLQQMVVALADTLKVVTSKLDEAGATSRKALADQRLLIEGMTDNVRVLRERADDTNVRLSSITQELESIRQTIASQPQPATPTVSEPATDPATGAPTTPTAPASGAVVPPPNISPQRTYDSAFSDYTAGHYDIAIEGFETFLKFFPRHPNADDAQVNIGNALYNAGKYRDAVTAYQRVVSDYPKTESVPQAYFKMGLSYQGMKELALARKAFETVIQNYPTATDYTSLARQALDRLPKQ
jgi:tol-pal system protein YbgF